MIIKIKIKSNKKDNKKAIIAWIQKHDDFDKDVRDVLNFFKDQIRVFHINKIHQYYKITSDNPAIMLSLISSIQELFAESYFSTEESIEFQESVNF